MCVCQASIRWLVGSWWVMLRRCVCVCVSGEYTVVGRILVGDAKEVCACVCQVKLGNG